MDKIGVLPVSGARCQVLPQVSWSAKVCTLCEVTQPWAKDCIFVTPTSDTVTVENQEGGDDVGTYADPPVFSYDQISAQLTHGYWGGSSRAFDVSAGGTLYVDVSGLTADGQAMALQASNACSAMA